MNTVDKVFLNNEPSEELLEESSDAVKNRWLDIFIQLSNSSRFTSFIEENFDIIDRVNHEDKEIQTLVIEKPIDQDKSFELDSHQKFKIYNILSLTKCPNLQDTYKAILSTLGNDSGIILASTVEE